MTNEQLAYLAGIVDGEGCICLYHRTKTSVTLKVAVSNTDKPMIDWIRQTVVMIRGQGKKPA